MQVFTTYSDGKVHKAWDIDTRTYTEYAGDEAGTVLVTRPFNADENANADAWESAQQINSTQTSIDTAVRNGINTLQTIIGAKTDPPQLTTLWGIRNTDDATINANPAAYIRALAQGLSIVTTGLIRVCRIAVKAYTGVTDI